MKLWNFLSRHVSSLMAVAAAFGLGMLLGHTVPFAGSAPEAPVPEEPIEAAEAGNIGVSSILPETEVTFRYRFSECGHEYTNKDGADLTGYTLSDIEEEYPDCRVTEMDRDHATIERIFEEYCPEHYVLVWTEEETLSVFRTGEESHTSEELMQLAVDPESLDEALLAPLRSGLAFDSLQQIDAYLEDAES